MKRVPIISPNSAYMKKDDCTFFVLRNKVSTLESTDYKDIFCVVRDSYVNLLYKDIKNGRHSYEDSDTRKNECFLPSKQTPEFLWNTNEKMTENDKLSFSSLDTTLSENDVTTYSACNNGKNSHENNYDPDAQTVFDLRLFKVYLAFFFAIHPNSNISYMDNDDKVCVVETETEFLELWKFAKSCSNHNRGVLLLIDSTNNQEDSVINTKDKIPIANNQKSLYVDNVNLSKTFESNESMTEVKEHNDVQYSDRIFNFGESNNNLLNNEDDTSTLLGNLTESRSKVLTKEISDIKLESIVPSNINSQDFLNNAPPIWFVQYMEQLKKDIITEVSDQIMANVMENLNEYPMKSLMHKRHKNSIQCENEVYKHRSKCNHQRNNVLIDQKRQHKGIIKNRKKKEKKWEEKLEYNSKDDNNREKEHNHERMYDTSELTDNINNIYELDDTVIENKTVNDHDSMLPDFLRLQPFLKENLYNKPNVCNMTNENEFRMNCSITEHQMLDKKHFESKPCCCGSDTENISLSSDVSNSEEVSNEFEMISKPTDCENNVCYIKKKSPFYQKLKPLFHKKENIENTKDLQSFDVLPEMSSLPSSSICIDEDHFTASTNNIPTFIANDDLNISTTHKSDEEKYSAYEDVNEEIHCAHSLDVSNKYKHNNLQEFTNKICNKLIESSLITTHEKTTLPRTEFDFDEASNMKTDVNNSHTSYLTTEPTNVNYTDFPVTEHSNECQTDLNDLTQSFHSHTTSITDNGVYDIRETNTSTSHDYSKHSLLDSNKPTNSKENRIHEQIKKDFNNKNPEKKISREESNTKNGRHEFEKTSANSIPGTAEPVHILPETLVTGALHFASFAYVTAREALVKIRSNSKDDRSSHARKARH